MDIQRSFQGTSEKGTLYLVATPIGNLEDMTFRAVRVLKEADLIAAEDTRQTRKLLTHFEISTRLVSYHEHNKHASGVELIRILESGQSIALVSDAGMPAISDPGFDLVKMAIEHQIAVVPIPGANAALSALVISGLSTERFLFVGFLPREKKNAVVELEKIKASSATLLAYESPHRISKTLEHIYDVLGDRRVAVIRELTKKYEEVIRGSVQQCKQYIQQIEPRGEYCIVIEGNDGREELASDNNWWEQLTLEQHVEHYCQLNVTRKEAIKLTAKDRNMIKRDVYNQIHGSINME